MSAQSTATGEGGAGRLIVDASTLIRWSGPPVGIVRVEAELVRYVLDHELGAIISVYDTRSERFRPLDPDAARALIAGTAIVETSLLPDPRPIEHSALGAAARRAAASLLPLLKVRRTLACAVDEWRRSAGEGAMRQRLDGWVDTLADRRLRARGYDKDGRRRDFYRFDSVAGTPLNLGPRDVVLSAGLDWNYKDAARIAALKAQTPFRLVMMLYDLIPVVHPRFYAARDVDVFTRFFGEAIGHVDRFISISRCTTSDLVAFAAARGRTGLDIRNEKLGADAARHAGANVPLPAGLAPGRYVLFVSTVEPRKNHELLLRVWKRLAAGEAGGTGGFKLAFAGRRGWMTDHVFAALESDPALKRNVVHVGNASDELLQALYANAAFCVYPSLYEGFGLPVIEAFSHGKPVIASSAGSLPEAAGDLAPCLDPNDEDAWVEAMGLWLNQPDLVAAQARRIAAEFSWPTWPQAAARIVAVAREP